MKASVENVNSVQRRIKVELATDIVNNAFETMYRKVQQKARIKGFRPGKAPLNMIRKFYGHTVAADVADHLVRNHLFSAIEGQSIRPVAAPVLETMEMPEEGKEYRFTALVDIMPDMKVEGWKGLKLEYVPTKTDASAIDRELDLLRRRSAKTKDLPEGTPAAMGHMVYITHDGSLADGTPVEGTHAHGLPVELGKKMVLTDIEDALVGMKAGEKKVVDIKLPEDYEDLDLAGKTIKMALTVEKVQEMLLPELDDELAKDVGEESLESLKGKIREAIERQAEEQKRHQLEFSILKQLSEKNPIEVPPSMVDHVIDGIIDGMNWPSDKEREGAKRNQETRKRFLDSAKERTRNTLLLHDIIQSEKLTVNDAEIDQHLTEMIGGQSGTPPAAKVLANLRKNYGTQAKENLLITKAVDLILSSATVTEKKA